MRASRWVLAACLVGAGCTHQSRLRTTTTLAAVDTIWYVSARAREEGRVTRKLADSLEFGFFTATGRDEGDPLVRKVHRSIHDSVTLTRSAFIDRLRTRATTVAPADPVALLYVHGYGTWQLEAWMHAAQAVSRSQSSTPWVVFTWPSKGSGVSWPRAGAILARAYKDDSATAVASAPAFARTLGVVVDALGGNHVTLVAHSMGSQLIATALLSDTVMRARLIVDPLRAIALYKPDLDAARFADAIVPALHPLTTRLLLYASTNDRLLAFSKTINKSDRAGLIRGSPRRAIVAEFLETIDVTAGLTAERSWQRIFGTHHSLSRASGALFDIMHIVVRAFGAECRATLGTAQLGPAGEWTLTDKIPPLPQTLTSCRPRN